MVKSAIIFDRGSGVFTGFIKTIYQWRVQAKKDGNHVLAYILKLILNSLYGKTGQKILTDFFKFIHREDYEKHKLIYDTDLKQEFGSKVLVRDHGKLSASIRKHIKYDEDEEGSDNLISEDSLNAQPLSDFLEADDNRSRSKQGFVEGSVCVAAAVTAYGRIHMSKFKNIPGNPYLGGDTDSAIMQYPLDAKFIGDGLGLMKLEEEVSLGLMAGKKLYFLKTNDGKTISKSRGIGFGREGKSLLKEKDFIDIMSGKILTVKKPKFVIKKDKLYYRDEKIRVSVDAEILQKIKNEIMLYIASTPPRSKSLMSTIPRKICKIMKEVEKTKAKTENQAKVKAKTRKIRVVK